jgi:DNA invertase Pin-like site-specific DNA recombinase
MIAATGKKTKTVPELIPALRAVLYIRMSTPQQKGSPAQQREEGDKLVARNGWKLAGEYADQGISGDDTKKRKAFQQMMRDAAAGKFDKIIVWDVDRFGRFDSIESGYWAHQLRQAGVELVSVGQGASDLSSMAGRLMNAIGAEQSNQYNVKLSKGTLRGRLAKIRQGWWQGMAPFGYDRQIFNDKGEPFRRIAFSESYAQPKGFMTKLVPSVDAAAVETVQTIFKLFDSGQWTIHGIAREMNRRRMRSARGVGFSAQTIKGILRSACYAGHTSFGKEKGGKYHQIGADGEIGEPLFKKTHRGAPSVVVRDTHDPLVDPALFDRVQKRLATRTKSDKSRPAAGYPLASVLRCGHCGGRMTGHFARSLTHRSYTCSTGNKKGATFCRAYRIRADEIEQFALGWILERLPDPKNADRLVEAIKARFKGAAAERKRKPGNLSARISELDRKIAKGVENILEADKAIIPALQAKLTDWQQERARLTKELGATDATAAAGEGSEDKAVKRALAQLQSLWGVLQSQDRVKLAEVFRQLFESITLHWEELPLRSGKKVSRTRLARGVLRLRDGSLITVLSGDGRE